MTKVWAILSMSLVTLAARAGVVPPVDFDRDVRPILSENCISCHGPDKHKGDLRLDERESAVKPAKSGAIAIVPKQADKSELVRRITTTDADDHMPPADSHKALTAAQVDILNRWVTQGAPYEKHWSFIPPVRPALPAVKHEAWARNAIDRFILARLEAEKVSPSPEADKVTLLRRLSLDLIGLPPTIDEVKGFLADESPDAYGKQVDRLLASPHYGERWGRHWLDAARYADSDGFEKDKMRYVWFYRDYVINAFNADKPYNQFVIEQLAGDQLPHPTQDQLVATGFLRNSMLNEEGGVDPEQFRMDEMFDRMDCVGKSILGLTIQCAQCHNHKYDPLTQEEYYKLFAFLNNDHEASRVVYTLPEQMKVADLARQMNEIEGGLRHRTPDWEARMAAWESAEEAKAQPHWTVIPLDHIGDNSERYLPQRDGSYLAQGYAPTKHDVVFQWKSTLNNITGFRLELLPDPNLPAGGPGRSFKGTCALTEFGVDVALAAEPKKNVTVKFSSATSDFDQPEAALEPNFDDKSGAKRLTGPVKFAIDGDDKTAWGIDAGPGRRNVARKAVFAASQPIVQPPAPHPPQEPGSVFTFHLRQMAGGWNSDDLMTNNLGRFRISVTTTEGEPKADPVPQRVRDALAVPRARRTAGQQATIFSYWRTTEPEWKAENDAVEALWKQWPNGATTLTLAERDDPRVTHMLARGNSESPTTAVNPAVPAFLNPLPAGSGSNRLALADWLVDRQAPTTARVFVNRIWQAYFGTGIVATAEDFGLQGEAPSHPQLLDWLAVEFMESNWSIKHVHRLIVTSATYRQSSRVTPERYTADPYNRLLARGARFRVEGEIVRDIALAASGLLNEKVGGRSVMPPAPAFLFVAPASYAPFPWIDEKDDEKYRRAVYTFRRRSTPYPVLQTFDVPIGDTSCVRRSRSNSPLQALASLNEPIFVECARALAKKALEAGGTDDAQRIDYAFRRALAREPKPAELSELTSLLRREEARIASGELDAKELSTGGDASAKPPAGATPQQWAAYTTVSRVLLNLDETITKE